MCVALFRRNAVLLFVPEFSQCRNFCEPLRHHQVPLWKSWSCWHAMVGWIKRKTTRFQPITCYVWSLPAASPFWQSPKLEQFLMHPFDPTKSETSEQAVSWQCPARKAEMLLILMLPAAVPSPSLRTSVWGLLSVATHLAGLRVKPLLQCHSVPTTC